jgi:hypothetical protein
MCTAPTVRLAALIGSLAIALLAIALLAIAPLAHAPLAAQSLSIWSLEKGDRIRLVPIDPLGASGRPTIGQFNAFARDTIHIALESGGSSAFALHDVSRLSRSRGRTRATKYGVGIGLTVGAVVGLASGDRRDGNRGPCDPNVDPRCDFKIGPVTIPPGAVTATIAGLAIGGIVGSLIKYEAWNDVKIELSPQGFSFTLSMESRVGNRVRKNALPSRNMRR